jgi:dihydrofolate reductase
MRISLIVAMTPDRVIGQGGRLPWRQPDDLRHFKRITMGHPVIMGRKTWASLRKPLPGRDNIVLTRQPDFTAPGARVVHTVAEALAVAQASGATEAFVIGGGAVYALFLPFASRIYATIVRAVVEGDTFFPALPPGDWVEGEREDHEPDADNPNAWSFSLLERRGGET